MIKKILLTLTLIILLTLFENNLLSKRYIVNNNYYSILSIKNVDSFAQKLTFKYKNTLLQNNINFDLYSFKINFNIINIDQYNLYSEERYYFKLAMKESSNKWDTTKRTIRIKSDGSKMYIILKNKKKKPVYITYLGKYQMGSSALEDINKSHITYEKFKKNPNIWPEYQQDKDIKTYMMKNKYYLRNYKKYIGKRINKVTIDWSGLLAASHLVGNFNVKIYLESNGKIDPVDGNKIRCSHYIKEFSGYNIKLDN